MEEYGNKSEGLSGAALKYIAMASMLADHIGFVVLQRAGICEGFAVILRMVGRIAFPVYCFLLVEGFLHTRSRRNYFLRLILFAFISEIPFDLAAFNCLWAPNYQNVFFMLSAAFCVLWGLEKAEQAKKCGRLKQAAVIAAGCAVARLIRADYDVVGIAFVVAFYYFRNDRGRRADAAAVIGFLETLGNTMGAGMLSAIPIYLYNGRKGQAGNKYIFYWFYPVHLLALFLVRWLWIGIGMG